LASGVERVDNEVNLEAYADAMIATSPTEFEPPGSLADQELVAQSF
jgi:hypothetical protein